MQTFPPNPEPTPYAVLLYDIKCVYIEKGLQLWFPICVYQVLFSVFEETQFLL